MEESNPLNIVAGWDHPMSEYIEAHRHGRLLKLVTHLSNVCNLSCPGCFVNRPDDNVTAQRKGRRPNEMTFEDQIALLREAREMGVQTVDIVGAGEPTLDPHFDEFVNEVARLEMDLVVFTHGATRVFRKDTLEKYRSKPISFVIKLWSLNPDKMNFYVRGALSNYSLVRDEAIQNLEDLGFMKGDRITLDGRDRQTTRVGADVLVMKSNLAEIPDIFRFCRSRNMMPIIKTYIPQGPTKLDQQSEYFPGLSDEEQRRLRADAISPSEFGLLRRLLETIDNEEFGNKPLGVVYPQGSICTQSAGALYVTINGDILSCVGTGLTYGKYQPGIQTLSQAVRERIEQVGVGCLPRVLEAKRLAQDMPPEEYEILNMGN